MKPMFLSFVGRQNLVANHQHGGVTISALALMTVSLSAALKT